MAALGDLLIRIGCNIDGFEKSMGDVSKRLNAIDREAQKAFSGFDRVGQRLTALGATLSTAVTLPILGVGIAATKMASDFELGLRKVGSLIGGLADKEFRELQSQVLDLSRRLGIDAVKATEALYEAISAGVPKGNAIEFLEVASKAAIAGVTETKVAVDGLTSIINAYSLKTQDAKEVSDAMFQAVNLGKFQFQDLAASISIAIPMASQLGVGFKDVLSAAASLTAQGFNVAEAMTSIRAAMVAIVTPNKQMNELFARLGVTSGEALIKSRGLQGALEALRGAAGGNAQILTEAMGRVEGLGAALGLTGEKAQKARIDLDSVRQSTEGLGAATVAYNEINKTTARQFEAVLASVKATAIELGTALLPSVNKLLTASQSMIEWLTKMVNGFNELPKAIQNGSLALAGFAFAIGPILFVTGTLISSFARVASAVTGLAEVLLNLATAALPVVTAAFTKFGTVALPAVISGLRTLATTTLPNLVLQVGLLSRAMLTQAIASFSTFATVTIPAATAALVRFAVTAIPAAIGGLVTFATTSVPAAITGLRTFTVSTIPAATAALIRFATAGIGAATAGMASFTTSAAPFVIAALSTMALVATVAATAFAAFKLGEWADRNVPGIKALGDAITGLILKIPGVERLVHAIGGVKTVIEPVKDLEAQVRATEAALRAQGIAVEQGGLTLTQYASKLADLKKTHGEFAVVVGKSGDTINLVGAKQADLTKELEAQEKALSELKKGYDLGVVSAAAIEAQTEKVRQAYLRLHPEIKRTAGYSQELIENNRQSAASLAELGEAAFKAQFEIKSWAEILGITNEEIGIFARSYPILADEIVKESKTLTKSINASFGKLGDIADIVEDSQKEILKDMRDLGAAIERDDPFKKLGITSQSELRAIASRARDAYNQIKSDARSTAVDVQRAWVKMIEAQIAAGDRLPKETLNQYEKVKAATGDTVKAVNNAWSNMSKQISTIVTDLSRGIADAIVNFKSLGDVGLTVVKNIATAILRTLIEGAIHKLANELAGLPGILGNIGKAFGGVTDQAKTLNDTLKSVTTGLGGVLGTSVGATGGIPTIGGIPGMPNGGIGSPSDFPKIPGGPGIPGGVGGAGTSGASTAIGSSLTGIVGAVGSVVSAISGVISNFQLARQEGTLNAIEQHTKVMAISMAGISAPWEKVAEGQDTMFEKFGQIRNVLVERLPWIATFAHESASALQDFIAPNIALMTASVRAIEQVVLTPPQAQKAAAGGQATSASITINVNGAQDPAATAKAVMELLKTQSPVFV